MKEEEEEEAEEKKEKGNGQWGMGREYWISNRTKRRGTQWTTTRRRSPRHLPSNRNSE